MYIYIYPHIYTYIPVKSLLRTDQIMLAKINQLLSPNVVGIVRSYQDMSSNIKSPNILPA
jgi:hypothetical protein